MGCCSSKPEQVRGNDNVTSRSTTNEQTTNHQVPPIIITKAQSVASVESFHASSSANIVTKQEENQTELEKPPMIIEEQTQEHQYGEPPAFEEQAAVNPKAVIKDTKPVIIVTPQSESDPAVIPAPVEQLPENSTSSPVSTTSEIENTNIHDKPWTILVRLSTSGTKDKLIDIPTSPPFMTVSELKNKINMPSDQQIKLIHLGRILKDEFVLVPSSITSSKSDTIKVSDRGVIQAMVYRS